MVGSYAATIFDEWLLCAYYGTTWASRWAQVQISIVQKISETMCIGSYARRERSRSRDARPPNDTDDNDDDDDDADRRRAYGLEQQIICRGRQGQCLSDEFEVYVYDPERPQMAALVCARCRTINPIDLARRLDYAKGGPKGASKGKGHYTDRNPAYGLEEQITCRERDCPSRVFEVDVRDPERPERAELVCFLCETITGIDLARRIMYVEEPGRQARAMETYIRRQAGRKGGNGKGNGQE